MHDDEIFFDCRAAFGRVTALFARRYFTLPWRGRVGSHRAQRNVSRGGVISQLGQRLKRETVTPPRRSFQSRRPQERASLVSTPPGEGKDFASNHIGRTSTTSGTKCFSRFWMPCCSVAV